MSYIEIRNLKKEFDDLTILDNISFSIEKGEMVAIVGKSGTGKSTLLHILAGIDRSDSGIYYLAGKKINDMSDKKISKIRNHDIGYVMQNFGLISGLTAYENIIIPLQINTFWGNVNVYENRIEKKEKRLDIVSLLNKKANLLSGGEQQRVAIARAMINNPKVILADEPTGSLDYENSKNIMRIFEKLKKDGHTIILVTHDLNIAKRCDRIINIQELNSIN